MSMKKIIFIVGVVCLLFELNACKLKAKEQTDSDFDFDSQIVTSENSRTGLDWTGTYKGVIPSADGRDVEVQITLNEDSTYQISWKFQENEVEANHFTGTFDWDDEGNIIMLGGLEKYELPNQYLVGENILILMAQEENGFSDELPDDYILTKK